MLPKTSSWSGSRVEILDREGNRIRKKGWLSMQMERINKARVQRVIEKSVRIIALSITAGYKISRIVLKYTILVLREAALICWEIIILIAMQIKKLHLQIKQEQKVQQTNTQTKKKVEIIITQTKIIYYE
jgi:hypothetical protein